MNKEIKIRIFSLMFQQQQQQPKKSVWKSMDKVNLDRKYVQILLSMTLAEIEISLSFFVITWLLCLLRGAVPIPLC